MSNEDIVVDKLIGKYPLDVLESILRGLKVKRRPSLRINTLKAKFEDVLIVLSDNHFSFEPFHFYSQALSLKDERNIKNLDIYKDGLIYMQSLSSMIPPIILNAKPNENILDMCAAPGGKTSEICALSNNTAMVTACDKNRIRTERLIYNLEKLGCEKVNVMNQDARSLSSYMKFDKILLDAPCSGSGTLDLNKENENFDKELIDRSVKFQIELLSKAFELVRPGGTIIYSTCSIFDEENDGVIEAMMNKYDFTIKKVELPLDKAEILDSKYGLLLKPNEYYEGFYVAKLIKK